MTGLLDGPDVYRDSALPAAVSVYEVGARDGLQAESVIVPTEVKAQLIRRLVASGLRSVELTSFVAPRRVPQLADAEELLAALDQPVAVRAPVLVPNLTGLERARAAGAREVAVFVSATESFAQRNLNRSREQALVMSVEVVQEARAGGLPVRGYVSMCFGDPWEGRVALDDVVEVSLRLLEAGCTQLSLGDTIGVATPSHVQALVEALKVRDVNAGSIALHLHDTYGQALANVHAALVSGITEFDSSAGGLGRCPYAKGATGNLATEDLVWMLHGLGCQTGVDLAAVAATTTWLTERTGLEPASRVHRALTTR